jgi:DNA-binding CsgD family transcriptional regulator
LLDQLAGQPASDPCTAIFRSVSGKASVLARIAPLRDGDAFGIAAWRAKGMHERELPDLRALLGLTRSEASLVRPLLEGRLPQAIATDLNLSVETVRSHLKNAYAKAGVTNRNAFVSLLTSLLP